MVHWFRTPKIAPLHPRQLVLLRLFQVERIRVSCWRFHEQRRASQTTVRTYTTANKVKEVYIFWSRWIRVSYGSIEIVLLRKEDLFRASRCTRGATAGNRTEHAFGSTRAVSGKHNQFLSSQIADLLWHSSCQEILFECQRV